MYRANVYSYEPMKQVPRVKQSKHLCSINPFYGQHSSWSYDYQLRSSAVGWEQNLTSKWLSRMAEGLLFSGLFAAMNTLREYIFYSWHPLLLHLQNTCVLTIQNVPAVRRPSRKMTLWNLLCVSKIMFRGKLPEKNGLPYVYSDTLNWTGYKTVLILSLNWK